MKGTLVVEARAATQLLADLLAPASTASIQQGQSFWPMLMGTRAFSDKLTVIDPP